MVANTLINAFPNGAFLYQCGVAELFQPWEGNFGLIIAAAPEVTAALAKVSCQIEVFDAAMDDNLAPDFDQARVIWDKANRAADRGLAVLDSGRAVISVCAMGHNRSALVSGLMLRHRGVAWVDAIHQIRLVRGPLGFNNPAFVGMLARNGPISTCRHCGHHVGATE